MKFYILALFLFSYIILSAQDKRHFDSIRDIATRVHDPRHPRATFSVKGLVLSRFHNELTKERFPVLSIFDNGYLIHATDSIGTNNCQIGDVVFLSGYISDDAKRRQPKIFATHIKVIGHRDITPSHQEQQNDVEFEIQSKTGVIVDVLCDELDAAVFWITLATGTGFINARIAAEEYSLSDLKKLLDADVTICGVPSRTEQHDNFIGLPFFVLGRKGIHVIRPAPANPFDAAPLSNDWTTHRQVAHGIVIGHSADNIFISLSNSIPMSCAPFLVVKPLQKETNVTIGSEISAAGFAFKGRFGIQLVNALVKISPPTHLSPPEPAISLSPRQLFVDSSDRDYLDTRYHGRRINISGIAHNGLDKSRPSETIKLDCETHILEIDGSNLSNEKAASIEPGCKLSVTGICTMEFEPRNAGIKFPRFRRFLIVPQTDDEVDIIARPPWFTTTKFLIIIAILIGIIVAILLWNKTLKVLSERRARELAKEKISHAKAEVKVEERTRLSVELHDSLSQTISGIAFQVDTALSANRGENPAVDQILNTAKSTLASCRKDLQCCLWDLRSRTFEESDMTEAAKKALEPYIGTVKTTIRFNVSRQKLSETTTHAILQIVRELVINAIRHGKATEVKVAGELHDETIRFSVRDNGSGFDLDSIPGPRQGHFGLHGIRERLRNFDGALAIESEVGKGSRFIVTMKSVRTDNP